MFLTISRSALTGLLLLGAFFAIGCLGPTEPAASTEGSFGYRFEPDQELVRGSDDQATLIPGPGAESASPPVDGSSAPDADPTPESPTSDALVLGDPPEQRLTPITGGPYPEEWTAPPPETGIFASKTRVVIMIVLVGLVVVSAVGVVRNW